MRSISRVSPKEKYPSKSISELRQDVVSGDWVVIATGRGRRPNDFYVQKRLKFRQPKRICPFEKLQENVITAYPHPGAEDSHKNWWVQVIPNKYPAFGRGICAVFHNVGPYQWTEGVGFHEVVVTRDHDRPMGRMSDGEVEIVIRAYQERYLALRNEGCVEYISIFHNHGREAGATIYHPHSQIIAIPVTPPDFGRSLRGSASYFHGNKACIHCIMLGYELKAKKRIVYENDYFAVIAPFASKTAFEIRIFPKKHNPRFELISPHQRRLLANALRVSLAKLYVGLKNPDYNFFIHTAPTANSEDFHHYHWHLEIIPKTAIWAGFEIGTGIEISTIAPESAAEFLKNIKI